MLLVAENQLGNLADIEVASQIGVEAFEQRSQRLNSFEHSFGHETSLNGRHIV